jgi:metallophosphoesterase (TIGR00282 family)
VKILAIGDVTSQGGLAYLCKNLWRVREKYGVDFCVVNGENASFITGISRDGAEELLRSGADVITGGNHTLQNHAAYSALDECEALLRPINYGAEAAGRGYTVADLGFIRILVINAMGTALIEPSLDSPYPYIDRVLEAESGKYDIAIMDFHAEATGEKLAIAHHYDGKINVIFGTHTHVPTADDGALPNGTGYVTDLGMCGESGGILGMEIESVIFKMRTHLPGRFKVAPGECRADGVIFTLDGCGKCTETERIKF